MLLYGKYGKSYDKQMFNLDGSKKSRIKILFTTQYVYDVSFYGAFTMDNVP